MEEFVLSKEELVKLFDENKILDTDKGWYMEGKEIEIVALHDIEPKFLRDIANAKYYKIIIKGK